MKHSFVSNGVSKLPLLQHLLQVSVTLRLSSCIPQILKYNLNTGASKAAATHIAHGIITLRESYEATERMIEGITKEIASSKPSTDATDATSIIDLSLNLASLQTTSTRLKQRIDQSMHLLTGKDNATASAIKASLKDEFQNKIYKCRALLIQLVSKVRQALLAAVPFKRRISRAKKGKAMNFYWLQSAYT
jgi:hypothetical protein